MKITKRQKKNIIAKWMTGEYTKTELAKIYKVSEGTIRNVIGKKEPTHQALVDEAVNLERKKLRLNYEEKQAIERVVRDKTRRELENEKTLEIIAASSHYTSKKALLEVSKMKKPTLGDLKEHSQIIKNIRQTVAFDEKANKPDTGSSINVQQFQLQSEQKQTNVEVSGFNENDLVNELKKRELPISSTKAELQRLGLI